MIDRRLKKLYRAIPLKANIFRAMKSLHLVPPARIHERMHFESIFTINVDSSEFRMYGYGPIEASIFWRGLGKSLEGSSLLAWAKLCKRHDVIMDVGANAGVFALIAKTVNPRARVYAFEPMPRVFAQLQRNRDLNGYDIELVQAAASNFDGTGQI